MVVTLNPLCFSMWRLGVTGQSIILLVIGGKKLRKLNILMVLQCRNTFSLFWVRVSTVYVHTVHILSTFRTSHPYWLQS